MNLDAEDCDRICGFDREVCRSFEFNLNLLTAIVVVLIDEIIIGHLDLHSGEEK